MFCENLTLTFINLCNVKRFYSVICLSLYQDFMHDFAFLYKSFMYWIFICLFLWSLKWNFFFLFQVNLNKPMTEVLDLLNKYPIRTRLSLTGTLIVARDIAHAKLQERLESGEGLPEYFKNHPVYYAGPAKTPEVWFELCSASTLYWEVNTSHCYLL